MYFTHPIYAWRSTIYTLHAYFTMPTNKPFSSMHVQSLSAHGSTCHSFLISSTATLFLICATSTLVLLCHYAWLPLLRCSWLVPCCIWVVWRIIAYQHTVNCYHLTLDAQCLLYSTQPIDHLLFAPKIHNSYTLASSKTGPKLNTESENLAGNYLQRPRKMFASCFLFYSTTRFACCHCWLVHLLSRSIVLELQKLEILSYSYEASYKGHDLREITEREFHGTINSWMVTRAASWRVPVDTLAELLVLKCQ